MMEIGSQGEVSADGSGLVVANPKPDAAGSQSVQWIAAKPVTEVLEAEPDPRLPVPKQHSMNSLGTGKRPQRNSGAPGTHASVPAALNSVLAFYRGELAKRGWKESAERAIVKPDQASSRCSRKGRRC